MRWQLALKNNITDLVSLLDDLEIPESMRILFTAEDYGFPIAVPRHFVGLMEKGNIHDPLLKQVLPVLQEGNLDQNFEVDPLQEKRFVPVAGCLHKYQGRVLVITAGRCAINCRYCFRRHFPYADHQLGLSQWTDIVGYIQEKPSIREVIFSGGEPFLVSDTKLAGYMEDLEQISHVDLIRFHTRMLITLPERMDEVFFKWIGNQRIKKVIVFHVNHPQELHPILIPLFQRLKMLGVTLLNQSVLLRGVNDEATVLEALSRKLFDYGVLPYYLHQLDAVKGVQHFLVPLEEGRSIYKTLKAKCPGYLVPRYVVELPGLPYKETLDESTAETA